MTPSVLPCLLRSPLLAPSPRTITSLGVSSPLVFHCFAEAKKLAAPLPVFAESRWTCLGFSPAYSACDFSLRGILADTASPTTAIARHKITMA